MVAIPRTRHDALGRFAGRKGSRWSSREARVVRVAVERRSPRSEIRWFGVEMKGLGEKGSPGDSGSRARRARVLNGNKRTEEAPPCVVRRRCLCGCKLTCGAPSPLGEPAPSPLSDKSKPVQAGPKPAGLLEEKVEAFPSQVSVAVGTIHITPPRPGRFRPALGGKGRRGGGALLTP